MVEIEYKYLPHRKGDVPYITNELSPGVQANDWIKVSLFLDDVCVPPRSSMLNSSNMKYYMGGPMSGIPEYNFPFFKAMTQLFRDNGYDIITPVEIARDLRGDPIVRKEVGMKEGQIPLRNDFLMFDAECVLKKSHGVIMLPNWRESTGAVMEAAAAIAVGKPLYEVRFDRVQTVEEVRYRIRAEKQHYETLYDIL